MSASRLCCALPFLAALAACTDPTEYTEPMPEEFSVVVLPDTQYYTESYPHVFLEQTRWIHEEAEARDIKAVLHVGDLVEHGDEFRSEWVTADAAFRMLETPSEARPHGIPYGIAPGNHDQTPKGTPGGTGSFNDWFGTDRFEERDYWGGSCGKGNDNSFITFEAGPLKFVVIFVAYDKDPDHETLEWMREVLHSHPDHLGILAGHSITTRYNEWSKQGKIFFDAIADEPQMRFIVAGHARGEHTRIDSGIYTMRADYQYRDNGGNGWLRLLTFRPEEGVLEVQTYSPLLDEWERDEDSEFWIDMDFELPLAPIDSE